MRFTGVYTKAKVSPGELLEALKDTAADNGEEVGMYSPVDTLDEQHRIADEKLDSFLTNLSRSSGAVRTVERFYEEEHGESIDATDVDTLKDRIPGVDSVLHEDVLPVVSKEDLRGTHSVKGAYGTEGDSDGERPSLVPDWVQDDPNEPYLMNSTGGTTGEPWNRAMTRNDTAVMMASCIRILLRAIEGKDLGLDELRIANPWPHPASKRFITEAFSYLGADVEEFSHDALTSGSDEERKELDRVMEYLGSGEVGVLIFPIKHASQGAMGVEMRRGNLRPDVLFNAGFPFSGRERELAELAASEVLDVFGETEYAELALWVEDEGIEGYELPLNTQINLVYDSEQEELSYEGTGRFAYFSFGVEGHIVPGVYLSGVKGTLEIDDGERQLLRDVERVEATDEGCY